eukprot:31341-Pelagococcus_subviridis.AAC.5
MDSSLVNFLSTVPSHHVDSTSTYLDVTRRIPGTGSVTQPAPRVASDYNKLMKVVDKVCTTRARSALFSSLHLLSPRLTPLDPIHLRHQCDQMRGTYSVQRRCKKWTGAIVSWVLDVVAINIYALLRKARGDFVQQGFKVGKLNARDAVQKKLIAGLLARGSSTPPESGEGASAVRKRKRASKGSAGRTPSGGSAAPVAADCVSIPRDVAAHFVMVKGGKGDCAWCKEKLDIRKQTFQRCNHKDCGVSLHTKLGCWGK